MPIAQRPDETLQELRARKREIQRRSDAKYREARLVASRRRKARRRAEHPEIVAAENRRWAARHRAERAAQSRAYYRAHRDEQCAKRAARMASDPAAAEAHRASDRRYYATHRAAVLMTARQWRLANRERRNIAERVREGRRRVQTRGAVESSLTRAEWVKIRAGQLGLCAYCFRRRRLTLDHIVPISRGGAHIASNVAGACHDCNRHKHNTTLLVWLARRAKERSD